MKSQIVSEKRTQIYLPIDLYLTLKETASKRGISMAQVIREALEEKVGTPSTKEDRKKAWKKVMKLAGGIKGEPKDISSNMQKYLKDLYVNKWK